MYSLTLVKVRPVQTIWPYVQIARIDHWPEKPGGQRPA